MEITIDIPEYIKGEDAEIFWEEGSIYKLEVAYDNIELRANKNAMISFAKELLYFAYNDKLQGSHIDFESGLCKDTFPFMLTIHRKKDKYRGL